MVQLPIYCNHQIKGEQVLLPRRHRVLGFFFLSDSVPLWLKNVQPITDHYTIAYIQCFLVCLFYYIMVFRSSFPFQSQRIPKINRYDGIVVCNA